MKRDTKQPTVTNIPRGGEREDHPAFAVIRATRVSGQTTLFGSDFEHNHYVSVEIAGATRDRNLSSDWIHGALDPYIRIEMSEAQWATFVSTLNAGSGTPCTLTNRRAFRAGEIAGQIPQISQRPDRRAEFNGEMFAALNEAAELIEDLRQTVISNEKIGIKAREALELKIRIARDKIGSSSEFVARQFGEHVETTIEAAKVEVHAYLTAAVMRAGLTALGANPVELPALDAAHPDIEAAANVGLPGYHEDDDGA